MALKFQFDTVDLLFSLARNDPVITQLIHAISGEQPNSGKACTSSTVLSFAVPSCPIPSFTLRPRGVFVFRYLRGLNSLRYSYF